MKNNIFNSTYEMTLRVIMITNCFPNFSFTVERMAAYDLIATYGKNFEISKTNLHGNNVLYFSELQSRISIIKETSKEMLVEDLINLEKTKHGYTFVNSTRSKDIYDKLLVTEYGSEYCRNIVTIHKKFKDLEEVEIYKLLNDIGRENDKIE